MTRTPTPRGVPRGHAVVHHWEAESDISNASGVFYGGKSEKEDALGDLKKYHASKSAQVKEKVVKAIAQALKGLGISSSSDNIHELIKHIPDPAKDTFPDDAEVHAEICKEIAKHINGALGHVIDERDPQRSSASACTIS